MTERVRFQLNNAREWVEGHVVFKHGHDTLAYSFIAHLAAYVAQIPQREADLAYFSLSKALESAMAGAMSDPFTEVARIVAGVDVEGLLKDVGEDARTYATSLQEVIVGILNFLHSRHIRDSNEKKTLLFDANARVMRYLGKYEGAEDALTKFVQQVVALIQSDLRMQGFEIGFDASFSAPAPPPPASQTPTVADHEADVPDVAPLPSAEAPLPSTLTTNASAAVQSPATEPDAAMADEVSDSAWLADLNRETSKGPIAESFLDILNSEERDRIVNAIIAAGGVPPLENEANGADHVTDRKEITEMVIKQYAVIAGYPLDQRMAFANAMLKGNSREIGSWHIVRREIVRFAVQRYRERSQQVLQDARASDPSINAPDTDRVKMQFDETVMVDVKDPSNDVFAGSAVTKQPVKMRDVTLDEAMRLREVVSKDSQLSALADNAAKKFVNGQIPETTGEFSERGLKELLGRVKQQIKPDQTQEIDAGRMVELLFDSIRTDGGDQGSNTPPVSSPPPAAPPAAAPPASPPPAAPPGQSGMPVMDARIFDDRVNVRPLFSMGVVTTSALAGDGIDVSSGLSVGVAPYTVRRMGVSLQTGGLRTFLKR